jgi:hypothetical protein
VSDTETSIFTKLEDRGIKKVVMIPREGGKFWAVVSDGKFFAYHGIGKDRISALQALLRQVEGR